MARGAFLRSRLVEEHLFAFYCAHALVAGLAAHALVGSLQREGRARFVIEQGGFPASSVVAVRAGRAAIGFRELCSMHVLVALFALGGRGFEVHVDQSGFQVGWLVAIDASGGAMGSRQREGRLVMIEALQLFP